MRMRTLSEAAAELGMSRNRLRRRIEAGKLPYLMWGNRMLVDLDEIGPMLQAELEAESMVGFADLEVLTGLSTNTLRQMCAEGIIPFVRDSRNYYRFDPEAVQAALREHMRNNNR